VVKGVGKRPQMVQMPKPTDKRSSSIILKVGYNRTAIKIAL
jgi:hypothetical protein